MYCRGLFVVVLLVFGFAHAEGLPMSRAEKDVFCAELDGLARDVMTARQAGMPMPKVMQIMTEYGSDDHKELGRSLVKSAYAKTRWQTERQQQMEIDKFADFWAAICYKQADK